MTCVHTSEEACARARVLLKCDEGSIDEEAAEAVGVSVRTVERCRKRFCTGGLDAALKDRPQPPRPRKRKIDGDAEARLVTLACSTPPGGRESRALQLLADSMVRLKFVGGPVSDETVGRVLTCAAEGCEPRVRITTLYGARRPLRGVAGCAYAAADVCGWTGAEYAATSSDFPRAATRGPPRRRP